MTMSTQYFCRSHERRSQVLTARDSKGNPVLNGIDYLELSSPDQKTLSVNFLFPLPGQANGVPSGPALTSANVVIEGGVRITGILVNDPVKSAGTVLTVNVNAAGDFSTCTLRLVTDRTNPAPPAGFDPQLASVDFSFKAECPSDFDCRQVSICPPPALPGAKIDYLAKDYASFRQLIFDRLAVIIPG